MLTRKQRFVLFRSFPLPFGASSLFCISREGWADYFEAHGIQYAFFSAANSTALQDERARRAAIAALEEAEEGASSEEESESEESEEEEELGRMKVPKSGNKLRELAPAEPTRGEGDSDEEESSDEDTDDELASKMQRGAGISTPGSDEPDRTRILSVLELEDLFLSQAPEGSFFSTRFPSKHR